MRLLLSVEVPPSEDPETVQSQLEQSKGAYISITADHGVTFDVGLNDVALIGVIA